jgi:hypothetical protein
MSVRFEATHLPLRVARESLRQIRDLKIDRHAVAALDLTISSSLEGLLLEAQATELFICELEDILGSVISSKVQLQLRTDTSFAPGDVSLALAEPNRESTSDEISEPTGPASATGFATTEHKLVLRLGADDHEINGSFTIGRSSSSDMVIADSEASRIHAEVSRVGGALSVRDLGSTNGTRVNDRIIEASTILSAGDVIRIGNTEISVVTAS